MRCTFVVVYSQNIESFMVFKTLKDSYHVEFYHPLVISTTACPDVSGGENPTVNGYAENVFPSRRDRLFLAKTIGCFLLCVFFIGFYPMLFFSPES